MVYEKGGVIKHTKAPARVKAELPNLWKKLNAWQSWIGSNIFLKTGMTVVCPSLCSRQGSEYHYNIVQKYLTKNAIPDCGEEAQI